MLKQYLETGKIVGTHGVKGMVRVQPWSDSGEFLTEFKHFYLDSNGEKRLEALKIQPHGGVVLMALKGIETIEEAEKLRNKVLFINRDDAKLPEGRYYIDDLIGCLVYDADSGKTYGTVSDISKTGANDVWHITDSGKEYLLPAIDEVVISVAPENGKVVIRPMKGIFDDED
ncbi:MAG: ribosome maturation factor RimM [Acutalibacteraceae bacterium]|nr:ribosome maturation factor RimM [Acutalibacteraceae bacterium]